MTDPARSSLAPFTAVGEMDVVDDGLVDLRSGGRRAMPVVRRRGGRRVRGGCVFAYGVVVGTGERPRRSRASGVDAATGRRVGDGAVGVAAGGVVVVGHRLEATDARGASSWLVPRPLPKRQPSTAPSARTWPMGPVDRVLPAVADAAPVGPVGEGAVGVRGGATGLGEPVDGAQQAALAQVPTRRRESELGRARGQHLRAVRSGRDRRRSRCGERPVLPPSRRSPRRRRRGSSLPRRAHDDRRADQRTDEHRPSGVAIPAAAMAAAASHPSGSGETSGQRERIIASGSATHPDRARRRRARRSRSGRCPPTRAGHHVNR